MDIWLHLFFKPYFTQMAFAYFRTHLRYFLPAILFCCGCATANKNTASTSSSNNNPLPDWAFGGFARPTGLNPIITPKADSRFTDPMSGKEVTWESNDTFNPGATTKDGKVVLLYRSEDKSGVAIGERTSRLGYAESSDGLHFTRNNTPVLYPGND